MDCKQKLEASGIKPSYQRLKVFEYLCNKRNHPTVDMVYKALLPKIPTLSKTTIYNTLHLFVEKKIVKILCFGNQEARFDADVSCHSHFICKQCHSIFDLDIDHSVFTEQIEKEFTVDDSYYYVVGICKNCNKTH